MHGCLSKIITTVINIFKKMFSFMLVNFFHELSTFLVVKFQVVPKLWHRVVCYRLTIRREAVEFRKRWSTIAVRIQSRLLQVGWSVKCQQQRNGPGRAFLVNWHYGPSPDDEGLSQTIVRHLDFENWSSLSDWAVDAVLQYKHWC